MPKEYLSDTPNTLSRRTLLKVAGATAFSALAFTERVKAQIPNIPESLSSILSKSPEYIKNNPTAMKSMAFVKGDYQTVMAAFSLLTDNSLMKTTLNRNAGKYFPPEAKPAPPLTNCLAISALPSNEPRIGKEIIIAGGYDLYDPSTPVASLAVSKDGGDSYLSKQLTQNPSAIIQMQHISQTDKFFLRLANIDDYKFTYGIYDAGSDTFSAVDGDYENAPIINDIYTSTNKDKLFGSGIVQFYTLDTNQQIITVPFGVNDFEIDLATNQMAQSQSHHKRAFPSGDSLINDLAVVRDENGKPKTEYEIRTHFDHHDKIIERKLYQMDMREEDTKNGTPYHDIGNFLDININKETGASAICVPYQITKTEDGLWVFGGYLQQEAIHPFAAYISDKNNFFYPHDKAIVYTFPTVEGTLIAREPEKVKLYSPNVLGNAGGIKLGKADGVFGTMVILEGMGSSFIETDGRGRPHPDRNIYYPSQ